MSDAHLPTFQAQIATRAAQEGIPVKAIARLIEYPLDVVYNSLNEAVVQGALTTLPKADWPSLVKREDRLPLPAGPNVEAEFTFACQHKFRLTNLEAAFLIALLKVDRVEKLKLHHIVEQQRLFRSQRPNDLTPTDPKMVDVMICKLRKKLLVVDERFVIKTIWGGGYFMDPEVRTLVVEKVNEGTSGC